MKNYITFIYFDLLSMLTTFKMNCFFFFFLNVINYVRFSVRNFTFLLRVSKKH